MPRRETLVQLTDELVERLDGLARAHTVSRSELIRQVLAQFVEREDHAEKVRRDIEGYGRCPPDGEFDAWIEWSTRRMVADEPWDEAE